MMNHLLKNSLKFIAGGALLSALGMILSNPTHQTRHLHLTCDLSAGDSPAQRVAGQNIGCLLVDADARSSSLWVD